MTIFPDYLFRRYVQGKQLGKEITLYSVWFELRWGITACLILTIGIITTVFYNHPSTSNVTMFFRTVPIVPETSGRVAETYVNFSGHVNKGAPLFRLDDSKQKAAVEAAQRKIAEDDAELVIAQSDLVKAESQIEEAKSAYQQALDELETKQELQRRNAGIVARREIEKLEELAKGRAAAVATATAAKQTIDSRITALLPAEKASAEAALTQAQVDLDKTIIRAGVSGRSSTRPVTVEMRAELPIRDNCDALSGCPSLRFGSNAQRPISHYAARRDAKSSSALAGEIRRIAAPLIRA